MSEQRWCVLSVWPSVIGSSSRRQLVACNGSTLCVATAANTAGALWREKDNVDWRAVGSSSGLRANDPFATGLPFKWYCCRWWSLCWAINTSRRLRLNAHNNAGNYTVYKKCARLYSCIWQLWCLWQETQVSLINRVTFEKYRDLETGVKGHWRSLEMSQFDFLLMFNSNYGYI